MDTEYYDRRRNGTHNEEIIEEVIKPLERMQYLLNYWKHQGRACGDAFINKYRKSGEMNEYQKKES